MASLAAPSVDMPRALGLRHVDAGLRLLSAGVSPLRLRWSTDPDAPAHRNLADGEIRLRIERIEVRRSDLSRLGSTVGRPASLGGDPWMSPCGVGVGVVVESRARACAVGAIVRGQLPVGTHCVLQVVGIDGHGLLALGVDALASSLVRYAWCAGPLQGTDAVGMEAVERAVGALCDLGHAASTVVTLLPGVDDSNRAVPAPITVASCLFR